MVSPISVPVAADITVTDAATTTLLLSTFHSRDTAEHEKCDLAAQVAALQVKLLLIFASPAYFIRSHRSYAAGGRETA